MPACERSPGSTYQARPRARQPAEKRRAGRLDRVAEGGYAFGQVGQCTQVLRRPSTTRQPPGKSLQVADRRQACGEVGTQLCARYKLFNDCVAHADLGELGEGPQQPAAEHAPAHRRDRAIAAFQASSRYGRGRARFRVARGDAASRHRAAHFLRCQRRRVCRAGGVRGLDGGQVPDDHPGGGLRQRQVGQARLRICPVKIPLRGCGARDPDAVAFREPRGLQDQISWHQHLSRREAFNFGGRAIGIELAYQELADRHVGPREADAVIGTRDRQEIRGPILVEQRRISDGARGERPHHAPLTDRRSGRRLLFLFADGHAVAASQQTGQEGIEGVRGEAALRDRLALPPDGRELSFRPSSRATSSASSNSTS